MPVSVQATGMGQPSTAIYVHELINSYGAKTLVRVGTCGGLSEKVKVRDLVIAMTACTDGAANRSHFAPYDYAPFAEYGLLKTAVELAESRSLPHHVGSIVSSDTFYIEGGLAAYERLRTHGVIGVEMETSTLYTLAQRFGVRALSICAMSDCLVTGDQIDASARQATLNSMMELALDTVFVARTSG
jgi:purine-nucleoside phosphorylase